MMWLGNLITNLFAGACSTGTALIANDAVDHWMKPPQTKLQTVVKGVGKAAIISTASALMFGAAKGIAEEMVDSVFPRKRKRRHKRRH